jgi:predicted membrane protein
MKAMSNKQLGFSMSGFLVGIVILLVLGAAVLKLAPYYIQDRTIKSKFDEVAHDPEVQNATVNEIRAAFTKRATVTDITAIKADDIEIVKENGKIILSASYSAKIPLFGNATLLLEFNPTSSIK